jgi:hypothetical protein
MMTEREVEMQRKIYITIARYFQRNNWRAFWGSEEAANIVAANIMADLIGELK